MEITNEQGLPQPFVDACRRQRGYRPGTYSVTELLKGTAEIVLSRRHDSEMSDDASNRVWAVFGSAAHGILEQGAETATQIKENRLSADIDGCTVTGQFDLYDSETKTVTDYKTVSVWRVIFKDWDGYRKQLLAYCWLLRKAGFEADRGQIVALIKDHSKSKAKRERDYPKYPVYTISWDFAEEDFEEFEVWLHGKLDDIKSASCLHDDELEPCGAEERWAKPTKYAVMLKGRKRALKLYDDRAEADIHAIEAGGYVEERKGADTKCEDYCPAAPFCRYYKETHGEEK